MITQTPGSPEARLACVECPQPLHQVAESSRPICALWFLFPRNVAQVQGPHCGVMAAPAWVGRGPGYGCSECAPHRQT